MSNLFEKLVKILITVLFASFVIIVGSITVSIFYKEVLKPEPPVECRSGKLFEVTTRDNIIVYEPTHNDCEVKS